MSRGILFLANVFLSDCVELDDENENEIGGGGDVDVEEEKENCTVDYVDFTVNDDINEEIDDENKNIKEFDLYNETTSEYDSPLLWFYNPEQWMKSTNCLCWWCTLPCQEIPWFIPLTKTKKLVPDGTIAEINENLDSNDNSLISSSKKCKEISVMKPYGVFCSPGCASAKLNREINPRITNKWQSMELLVEVYKMYNKNQDIRSIPEAYYPKEIMIQYAGSKSGVTPNIYRQMNQKKFQEAIGF